MIKEEVVNLKLIGKNEKDLNVISAYLQDSIVTTKDIIFLKKNRIFIMIVNRFMWEDLEKGILRKNKRVKSVVKFEEVSKVQSINIEQKNKNILLECLAIKSSLKSDKTYEIKIFFAGNGIITIISEVIDLAMHDISEPWDVKHVPKHKI
jgi:hypothetical protein